MDLLSNSPDYGSFSGNEYDDEPGKSYPKKRRRLTASESKMLSDIFSYNQKPNAQLRSELGRKLNMTPRANKRAKLKKDPEMRSPTDNSYRKDQISPNTSSLRPFEPPNAFVDQTSFQANSYLTPIATPSMNTNQFSSPRNMPSCLDFGQSWISPKYNGDFALNQNLSPANYFEGLPQPSWNQGLPVGPTSFVGSRKEIIRTKTKLYKRSAEELKGHQPPWSSEYFSENDPKSTFTQKDSKTHDSLSIDKTQENDVYAGHVYFSSLMNSLNSNANETPESKIEKHSAQAFEPINPVDRIETPELKSGHDYDSSSFNVHVYDSIFFRGSPFRSLREPTTLNADFLKPQFQK